MKGNSQIPGQSHVIPLAEGLSEIIRHFGTSRLHLPSWKAPRAGYAVLMIISRWLHGKGQMSCFELCFSEVTIQLRYSVPPQKSIHSTAYRLHWKCSLWSWYAEQTPFLCPQTTENLVISLTVKESWRLNHNGLLFLSECSMDLIRLWVCP